MFFVKLMCSPGSVPNSHLPSGQTFRTVVLPLMAPDEGKFLGEFSYNQEVIIGSLGNPITPEDTL